MNIYSLFLPGVYNQLRDDASIIFPPTTSLGRHHAQYGPALGITPWHSKAHVLGEFVGIHLVGQAIGNVLTFLPTELLTETTSETTMG